MVLSKSCSAYCMGMLLLQSLWLLRLKASNQDANNNAFGWRGLGMRDWCKVLLVVWAAARFALMWPGLSDSESPKSFLFGIDQSTNMLVFAGGIVFSQVVEMVVKQGERPAMAIGLVVLIVF